MTLVILDRRPLSLVCALRRALIGVFDSLSRLFGLRSMPVLLWSSLTTVLVLLIGA